MARSWTCRVADKVLKVEHPHSERHPVWIMVGGSGAVFTREEGIEIANEILARCGQAPRTVGAPGRSAFG